MLFYAYDVNGKPVTEIKEIKIPKYKVVTVFDISQTEGKPLPELDIRALTGKVPNYDTLFNAIKRTANIPINFEDIQDGSNGYYHKKENRISIKEGMDQAQTIKTAIHELTHSRLDNPQKESQAYTKKDRQTKEVIAESCAFTVSEHFGLDTSEYSFGYIATWSSNKELSELKSYLQEIRLESAAMINELEGHLKEIQHELAEQKHHNDTIELLASDIAIFYQQYDPFEYAESDNAIDTLISDIIENIQNGQPHGMKEWLQSIVNDQDEFSDQASALIHRLDILSPINSSENITEKEELVFYVAECAELPHRGELHENLTLEEAFQIYDQIPSERLNSVKCIGFELKGAENHTGKLLLMKDYIIQTELIDKSPYYKNHPLVQKAISDMQAIIEDQQQSAQTNVVLNSPIYTKTFLEAKTSGELEQYNQYINANKLCAKEFSTKYEKAYSEKKGPEFLNRMIEKYGVVAFMNCH